MLSQSPNREPLFLNLTFKILCSDDLPEQFSATISQRKSVRSFHNIKLGIVNRETSLEIQFARLTAELLICIFRKT